MFFRVIKQCIQTAPYKLNNKTHVRFLCQIPPKEQILKQDTVVKAKDIPQSKYPGYEIIYKFPFMSFVSMYSKIKRNLVIGAGILVPTMFVLDLTNLASKTFCLEVLRCACAFTLALFAFGTTYSNLIGIIYYKDNKAIKIAYLDIWGKRIDIDTSIEDIKPLADNPRRLMDKLYRRVHIKSHKYPLKLLVGDNLILNKDRFISILGEYE